MCGLVICGVIPQPLKSGAMTQIMVTVSHLRQDHWFDWRRLYGDHRPTAAALATPARGRLAISVVQRVVHFPSPLHADYLRACATVLPPEPAGLAPVHQQQRELLAFRSGHQATQEGIPIAAAAVDPLGFALLEGHRGFFLYSACFRVVIVSGSAPSLKKIAVQRALRFTRCQQVKSGLPACNQPEHSVVAISLADHQRAQAFGKAR